MRGTEATTARAPRARTTVRRLRPATLVRLHLRRSRIAVLSCLLALLALVAVPGTAAAKDGGRPGHDRSTIAKARALPLNTVVTIEGTVTTPSGVFASSYSDQGFAIQDRTAGIFVSFPTRTSASLRRGTSR